jgi:hypothetical protein
MQILKWSKWTNDVPLRDKALMDSPALSMQTTGWFPIDTIASVEVALNTLAGSYGRAAGAIFPTPDFFDCSLDPGRNGGDHYDFWMAGAVVSFQSNANTDGWNLTLDGILGNETLTAMDEYLYNLDNPVLRAFVKALGAGVQQDQ